VLEATRSGVGMAFQEESPCEAQHQLGVGESVADSEEVVAQACLAMEQGTRIVVGSCRNCHQDRHRNSVEAGLPLVEDALT